MIIPPQRHLFGVYNGGWAKFAERCLKSIPRVRGGIYMHMKKKKIRIARRIMRLNEIVSSRKRRRKNRLAIRQVKGLSLSARLSGISVGG